MSKQSGPIQGHAAFLSPSKTVTTFNAQRTRRLHPSTKLFQSSYNKNNFSKKSPPRNEARIQQQLAKIFGKGSNEFTPLSLAGRCSQVNNNVSIDFLLIADPYDSQRIQNAYNSHLQSKNPPNEYIQALPLPLSPNDFHPMPRLRLHLPIQNYTTLFKLPIHK